MKTKELIRRLQEEDPSGELECCVGNVDIHFLEVLPSYYDGTQQILLRDKSKEPYYSIVGGKYQRSGKKVVLHTLPFSDVLWDHPEAAAIDYSDLPDKMAERYKKHDDDQRQKSKEFKNKLELDYFIKHMRSRADKMTGELYDLNETCKDFFEKHLSPNDPLPPDLPLCGYSYIDRRNVQWERSLELSLADEEWEIRLYGVTI